MDPERPNVPTAEPTPDSPAPTQTSPVTPKDTNTPGGPVLAPQRKAGGQRKLMIAIAAAIVLAVALIFLFLSPWSLFVSAAPTGPQLKVGDNKYQYACSVIDKSLVAKQLDIKEDINKEGTGESFAYDPANSKDKELDIAKKTDSKSVFSTCTLKLDRVQEGTDKDQKTSFINITLSLEQFPDETKASEAFKADKQLAIGAKSLPSLDDSYYSKPKAASGSQTLTVQPKVLHKNLIIGLNVPVDTDDTTGDKSAGPVSTIVKDVIDRLSKSQGEKPKNFNGINKIGDNNFTDSCLSVNYAKVAAALGDNTQFNSKTVSGNQAYAPDNSGGQTPNRLTSNCVLTFRTQYEADQAKAYQPPAGTDTQLTYANQYPHYLSLQIVTTTTKDEAKKFLEATRKEIDKNTEDKNSEASKARTENLKLGDGGLKVTLDQTFQDQTGQPDGGSRGQLFYITKGPNVYILATTYIEQATPYKTQKRTVTNDQVAQIYKELAMATKRAN